MPGRKVECPKRILEIWPRDHGKSQLFSVIKNIWEVVTDPYNIGFKNIDKMLVSNTMTLTEKWMRIIESELFGNVRLKADWGDLLKKSKVNNVGEKILGNGARLYARAYGSQVRGEHPSGVDVDDLENRVDAQNPDIRQKLYEFFTQDLYGTLSPETNLFLVGTIVHEEGLLNTLWNENVMTDGWTKIKYSAITDEGKALWPSRWSLERLEQRRKEVGELAFSQEYLNLPMPSENPTIRPEWIQYYTSLPIKPREMFVVTAIDTASGEKQINDYTAIASIGIVPHGDRRGDVFVLSVERGHWSLDEKKRKFFNHLERYGSDRGIVEINFDPSFMRILADEAKRRRVFNTVLVPVKAKPKEDKLVRLESVSTLFQNGHLWFLNEQQAAIREILLMPNGKNDDMADAVVWALRDLKNGYMRRMQSDRRGIDNGVLDAWYGG